MHYGLRADIFEEGVFHGQNGSQNFHFLTFVKILKNIFSIYLTYFWILQVAKYLIYDYFYFQILLVFSLNIIAPIALKP